MSCFNYFVKHYLLDLRDKPKEAGKCATSWSVFTCMGICLPHRHAGLL